MMQALLCMLWAIVLGAAVAGPLYWWLNRRHAVGATPAPPPRPASGPAILYLTPACGMALGPCASAARLRQLTLDCIERKIARAAFPNGEEKPSREKMASWPGQAALLYANRLDELAALQARLRDQFGGPPPPMRISPVPERIGDDRAPAWLMAITLGLPLVAALLWMVANSQGCGRCDSVTPPVVTAPTPPVVTPPIKPVPPPDIVPVATLELSTDTFFDYNRNKPMSAAHQKKVRAELEALFSRYQGIEIVDIAAHTDPIGTNANNERLGRQRAGFMLGVIGDIVKGARDTRQFKSKVLPAESSGNAPSRADFEYWNFCFGEYYLKPKKAGHFLPLENLPPARSDGRTLCAQANAGTGKDDGYPACARLPVPGKGKGKIPAGYPQGAEYLRELLACVAPMRHVLIKFRYDRLLTGSQPPAASHPHKE